MRDKRLAGLIRRPRLRRHGAPAPAGEDQARSWREAFERDPSAIGGTGFLLLPLYEAGRLVGGMAAFLLGWRGLRQGRHKS